jgi:cell pole-organizing protein PopZ
MRFMSDQTPNSTEDLNGAEPSMEDILASIRKIISEDEPVALDSPEDARPAGNMVASTAAASALPEFGQAPQELTSDAVTELAALEPDLSIGQDGSVDLNIDEVLAGLDEDIFAEDAPLAELSQPLMPQAEASSVDVAEISLNTDDDVLAFLKNEIPMETENLKGVEDFELPSAEVVPSLTEAAAPIDVADLLQDTGVETEDDEMDALLDEIMMTPDDKPDGQVEEFVPDAELAAAEGAPISEEQSDLDLVKSLMADLADDPGEIETEEELESLLAIPDVGEASQDILSEDALSGDIGEDISLDAASFEEMLDSPSNNTDIAVEAEAEDDILGDILDMTLDDELDAQAGDIDLDVAVSLDDITAAEQENILENLLDDVATDPLADDLIEDTPSLIEIAAAAEADAVAVESAVGAPAAAKVGLAAAAGAGLAAFTAKADAPETDILETEDQVIESDLTQNIAETPTEPTHSNQETSMPVKAVKTDAILDEVTETATAGAFAELNQVVEDKAIFNERGPRIGDLVQEALRPMLKEWLDANLKGIVERAVTKEVKRISKGQ